MDYKSCKYYSQGYCLKGEKMANGMNYTCIERNDCPEVMTMYMKMPYKKPEMACLRRPLFKKTCIK